MREAWQQITEGLASLGGEDPAVRGAVLVGTGFVALLSLAANLRRKRGRSRATLDLPEGEAGFIQIGEDVEEERPAKGKGA